MLELHIENYKEFFEQKTEVINNEQCKIVEYEQLLLEQKDAHIKRSFLKRFFDKNENEKINEIIEAIQGATLKINQTKTEIEDKKKSLLSYAKNSLIAGNDETGQKNRRLLAEKEAYFEINRATKEIEDICILSINALEQGIKLVNESNLYAASYASDPDYHVKIINFNKCFGEAIAAVTRFKKSIKYSKSQLLNYDQNVDTNFYEPLMNIISDDECEKIVLQASLSDSNKNIPQLNNTLSVIHASYKLVKNLNDKHTKRYEEKKAEYDNYEMDIELIAKKLLRDRDIKC